MKDYESGPSTSEVPNCDLASKAGVPENTEGSGQLLNSSSIKETFDVPALVTSYKNQLGQNVSQELKNKIINGQYVDFGK